MAVNPLLTLGYCCPWRLGGSALAWPEPAFMIRGGYKIVPHCHPCRGKLHRQASPLTGVDRLSQLSFCVHCVFSTYNWWPPIGSLGLWSLDDSIVLIEPSSMVHNQYIRFQASESPLLLLSNRKFGPTHQ